MTATTRKTRQMICNCPKLVPEAQPAAPTNQSLLRKILNITSLRLALSLPQPKTNTMIDAALLPLQNSNLPLCVDVSELRRSCHV
eukprot:6180341-Pleurochrysis_carterae.AAC.2